MLGLDGRMGAGFSGVVGSGHCSVSLLSVRAVEIQWIHPNQSRSRSR